MKIAVDCRMLGMSGIGVFLENILSYLIPQNTNIDFILIGSAEKLGQYKDLSNCQMLINEIPIFSVKELLFFPVKEINKCDVYFSPNFNIPMGISIPIFSTVHDVVFLDIKGLTTKIGLQIRKYSIKRALKISKKVFTVSNFSKERIQYHYGNLDKLVVVYNIVKPNINKFIIKEKSPYLFDYVLFVGNIKRHKGISLLLEAYRILLSEGFEKKLVIVGSCENFKTEDIEIKELMYNNKNDLVFTGRLSDDELYDIMSHATLLIQPSLYEGFGIPPLEALYFGIPVLISNIPVFKEIFSKLPVNYFNIDNIDDLVVKIKLYSETNNLNISNLRILITDLFNQSVMANTILNTFNS